LRGDPFAPGGGFASRPVPTLLELLAAGAKPILSTKSEAERRIAARLGQDLREEFTERNKGKRYRDVVGGDYFDPQPAEAFQT
jgi:hypothetical protein